MAPKHDALKQNAVTRSQIAECALRDVRRDPALSWLPGILRKHGIDPSAGILAAYSETRGQDGRVCAGTWLTASRTFWEFKVLVPVAGSDGPTVERFEERSISIFAHERGIGKSFGALAIEVLDELVGTERDG